MAITTLSLHPRTAKFASASSLAPIPIVPTLTSSSVNSKMVKPLPRRRHHSAKHRTVKPILKRAHQLRYSRPAGIPLLPSLLFPALSKISGANTASSTPCPPATVQSDDFHCNDACDSSFRPPMSPLTVRRCPSPCSLLEASPVTGDCSSNNGMSGACLVSPESSPTSSPSHRSAKQAQHIQFYEFVRVKHIPGRSMYPSEMKSALWSSMQEIHANAKRNTMEFAADSWDWRSATEEDEMYVHKRTQRHVHPVHVEQEQHQQARKFIANRRRMHVAARQEPQTRRT